MTTIDAEIVVNGGADSLRKHDSFNQDPAATKRKRVDELDSSEPRSKQFQRDILQLLEENITCPSFLEHEFDANTSSIAEEPAHKKARLSHRNSETSSIAAKLRDASYTSLDHIKSDATKVSQELVSSIRERVNNQDPLSSGRLSVDDLKQIQRIEAFEAHIKEVTDVEAKYNPAHEDLQSKLDADEMSNGHTTVIKHDAVPHRSGTVLTLFGNAPTPKQLFSSMQHIPDAKSGSWIKKELNIEEMSLPNGLTATNIMTVPGDDSKHRPTFEEAFAPPHNLPQLQPPKVHKKSSARDNIISWVKDPVQRSPRRGGHGMKGGYTVQSLATADWLNYGNPGPENVNASPREKRKLRDRALSSGEGSQPPPSRTSLEETLAREEEALFRRAFSSFAPSHDNARALVPEETKNLVWWHTVGERRFNETFSIDPALSDETYSTTTGQDVFEAQIIEDDNFNNILEELEAVENLELDKPETPPSKSDVEYVLQAISELLETLASHQRIRNASLSSSTAASRTPVSPSPTLASKIGKPDEPTDEEVSTYESLRRELAYLVLKLPPYALAKLNGDQLADLAVSRILPLQIKNVRGTLEEDQVARQAKLAQMATQSSIATLTRPSSSAGQHYSTTAQRTPAIGQAANTRYGQSAHYGTRSPAVPQYQRQAPTQQQYGTPSGPRPTYGQHPQYSRPQPGYGPANNQQYYQSRPIQHTPGVYTGYHPQYQQNTQQRPNYGSQPAPQYQQRSLSGNKNAMGYQTTHQNTYNQAGSPVKPAGYSVPPSQSQTQPRPNYPPQQAPGSGRATPTQYPSQPPTPVNGHQQQRPQPASATPQPPPAPPAPMQDTTSVTANGHS